MTEFENRLRTALRDAAEDAPAFQRRDPRRTATATGEPPEPGRPNRSRRWLHAAAAVVVVLVAVGMSWWGTGRDDDNRGHGAACAAELVLGGRTYSGYGEPVRMPRLGPAAGTGRMPACSDGGGDSPARRVPVFALSGVDPTTAVFADDGVWLRGNLTKLPEPVRVLYRPVRCTRSGTVSGRLSGIDTMPRGGDDRVRTPYTATLVAERGPGLGLDRHSSVTVRVRVTGTTAGGHDPRLLRVALADGRRVVVTTHCDGSRFAATALTLAR